MQEIVFKDQPDGNCLECKWNMAIGSYNSEFWCECPMTYVSNHICIMKLNLIENANISLHTGGDNA